jgi:hypothetical protein
LTLSYEFLKVSCLNHNSNNRNLINPCLEIGVNNKSIKDFDIDRCDP